MMTTKIPDDNSHFWEHVEELRVSFIKSVAVVALGTILLFSFFPFIYSTLAFALTDKPLILLTPLEGISSSLKASFWLSLAGTYPLWGLFFLRFALPGLKKKERGVATALFFSSLISLSAGIYFALTSIVPFTSALFAKINESLGENLWTVSGALSFELLVLSVVCLIIQLAATLLLLLHYGIVNWRWLADKRRQVYVALFVLSAALTPPDVITQLFTAIPLIVLFEISLLYARVKEALDSQGGRLWRPERTQDAAAGGSSSGGPT